VTSLPKMNTTVPKPNAAPTAKPGSAAPAATAGQTQVKRSATTARPQTNEERRRAQRVLLRMPILVHLPNRPKPIEGFTHTVSASGAMIILAEGLSQGTKLSIENPKTQKKVEAHVVRPPQMNPEGSLVPIEFTAPSPQFWNIFFPPTTQ
jgi:PilZ domain